jgi:hypothetical protein
MAEQIIDGTGNGFLAKVDNQNRLEVHSFTETAFETASVEGTAFNVNTLLRDVSPIGLVGSLLRITNNETFPIVLAGWFIGTDAIVMTSGVPLVSVNVEAFRPDSLASTLVGSAADPVLYQTQPAAGRVFGNVNITLAQGASIGVQIESSDGVGTFTSGQIYTGFQAFLAPQD